MLAESVSHAAYISRIENLMDPTSNFLLNMDYAEAEQRVLSGDAKQVNAIDGQFAICTHQGKTVRLARSIGRPMRYFLAKKVDGPCLIVAERMEEIRDKLQEMGIGDQFHPSYTRMVPAHFIVELQLIGCPDPNPQYTRYFAPKRNLWNNDLDLIGQRYVTQLLIECARWLDCIPLDAPIGVLFSGGIDSGAVLLVMNYLLLKRGQAPTRLKAFTLQVGKESSDATQAHQFVQQCGIEMLWETIEVDSKALNWREAVKIIEDYKPLDVQSATMATALCRGIRERYPDWKYLIDGDGGDENLKDYPIEENSELTIRSVLNNTMLYQEGWGVHAIKHSLTYSGGQSRGHVRTSAPAAKFGFSGFSPFSLPSVIEVAEGIPFIDITDWDHAKLYALKGDLISRGIRSVIGVEMPVFEKRRFQHGAIERSKFDAMFPKNERDYREELLQHFTTSKQ